MKRSRISDEQIAYAAQGLVGWRRSPDRSTHIAAAARLRRRCASACATGFIQASLGKLRDECLNADQFSSIEDARSKIEAVGRLQPASTDNSLGQLRLREYLKRSEVEEDGAS